MQNGVDVDEKWEDKGWGQGGCVGDSEGRGASKSPRLGNSNGINVRPGREDFPLKT